MLIELRKFWQFCLMVRNPVPVALDRLKLRNDPYVLHLRGGAAVELRPRKGDVFGFYEIMVRNDYLSGGQRLETGGTVIDVGANIGCFTVLAARLVGPSGRVFAIEPEESTFQQLLRNIELNGLSNVIPLKVALGGRQGMITLHSDANRLFSSVFSSVNNRPVQGVDQAVPVTTLKDLMEVYRISRCDFLKLDCEGAEHEIIANLSPATARCISQITMELHKVPGFDGDTVRSRLDTLGFRRVGTSRLPFYVQSECVE